MNRCEHLLRYQVRKGLALRSSSLSEGHDGNHHLSLSDKLAAHAEAGRDRTREIAARELAAEFGNDPTEWTV